MDKCLACSRSTPGRRLCCDEHHLPGRSSYQTRKQFDLCVRCGESKPFKGLTCQDCLGKSNSKQNISRAIRVRKGQCRTCPRRAKRGFQLCRDCRSRSKAHSKLRHEKLTQEGRCGCGQFRENGRSRCDSCSRARGTPEKLKVVRDRDNWRREHDIQYMLKDRLRSRLYQSCSRSGPRKAGSAVSDLGCSVGFFKKYIEEQFAEGMSWEDRGSFHLDHIVPLSSFDLTDRDQFLEACHYTNLQPLSPTDNISKSNKLNWVKHEKTN